MDSGSQPWKEEVALGPCPICGGGQVARGLRVNQNAEVGRIGLAYQVGGIFRGTEELHADLCETCGTVLRFYVRQTRRKWLTS